MAKKPFPTTLFPSLCSGKSVDGKNRLLYKIISKYDAVLHSCEVEGQ